MVEIMILRSILTSSEPLKAARRSTETRRRTQIRPCNIINPGRRGRRRWGSHEKILSFRKNNASRLTSTIALRPSANLFSNSITVIYQASKSVDQFWSGWNEMNVRKTGEIKWSWSGVPDTLRPRGALLSHCLQTAFTTLNQLDKVSTSTIHLCLPSQRSLTINLKPSFANALFSLPMVQQLV